MLTGRNWINGISLKNPNIKAYLTAAYEFLYNEITNEIYNATE